MYQRKAVVTPESAKRGVGDRKDLAMCFGQQNQGEKHLCHQPAPASGATHAPETRKPPFGHRTPPRSAGRTEAGLLEKR